MLVISLTSLSFYSYRRCGRILSVFGGAPVAALRRDALRDARGRERRHPVGAALAIADAIGVVVSDDASALAKLAPSKNAPLTSASSETATIIEMSAESSALFSRIPAPLGGAFFAGGVIAPDSDDDAEPSLLSSTGSTVVLFGPRSRRPCTTYQLADEETEADD